MIYSYLGQPNSPDNSSQTSSPKSTNFKSLTFLELLNNSVFPIYKVFNKENHTTYALKLFDYKHTRMSKFYENECRFAKLKHPNLMRYISTEDLVQDEIDFMPRKFSYILMEYAPFENFTCLTLDFKLYNDDKIIRSFFHQLIEGLQFLHSNNVFHLNLKLENLVLGEHGLLKISGLAHGYKTGDFISISNGSPKTRPPELIDKRFTNAAACDIYSAGIILFVLLAGHYPYSEAKGNNGDVDKLWDWMLTGDKKFWQWHSEKARYTKNFNEDFKRLFMEMTRKDPNKRISIRDIKRSAWYMGPVYTQNELEVLMRKLFMK